MSLFRKALKSRQRNHHERCQDGVHMSTKQDGDRVVTEEQMKMMNTQDIAYVEMKRVAEKIEQLKGSLHLLDVSSKQKNTHTFFGFYEIRVQSFDLAEHLNTVPELVDRVYNRPTVAMLQEKCILGAIEPQCQMELSKQRRHEYKFLAQRINQEKKLFVISQKLQTRKDLQDKRQKIKVKKETTNAAAIYKFQAKRKH